MLYIPQTISGGGGLKVWDVVVQGTGEAVGGLQALGTTTLVIAEIGGARACGDPPSWRLPDGRCSTKGETGDSKIRSIPPLLLERASLAALPRPMAGSARRSALLPVQEPASMDAR